MNNRRLTRRRARRLAPEEVEAGTNAAGLRFTVVCSRWNPTVTEAMLDSCLASLESHGARPEDVIVLRVPGAFELPGAAAASLENGRPDALVVLGAIVRGETVHHEILGHAVATALAELSASGGVPIGFGLLTCESLQQARDRTAKGAEAAEAAIEMANLRRELARRGSKGKRRTAKSGYVTGQLRIQARLPRSPDRPITRSPDGRRP